MLRGEFLSLFGKGTLGAATLSIVSCGETPSKRTAWVVSGEFPLRLQEEIDGIIRDVMWGQLTAKYESAIDTPAVARVSGTDFLTEFAHTWDKRGFLATSFPNEEGIKRFRPSFISSDRKTVFLNTGADVWGTLSDAEANRLTAYLFLRGCVDGQGTYQKVEEPYIERSAIIPVYLQIQAHEGLEGIGTINGNPSTNSFAAFHGGAVDSIARDIANTMGLAVPDISLTRVWQDLRSFTAIAQEKLLLSPKDLLATIQANDPRAFIHAIAQQAVYVPQEKRYQWALDTWLLPQLYLWVPDVDGATMRTIMREHIDSGVRPAAPPATPPYTGPFAPDQQAYFRSMTAVVG